LQALREGGESAAEAYLDRVERELSTVMLLTGSRTLRDLEQAPRIILGELKDWLSLAS
jgi:isopentenyl diphosphate isomerase/L-lactate dehydrogenase-like FMN-dependent dehydrogenase